MEKKMELCAIEGCKNKAVTRGLCRNCYYTARHMVRTGKTTWEELEKSGVSKPVRRMRKGKAYKAILVAIVKQKKSK